jgi:hypothetical protein
VAGLFQKKEHAERFQKMGAYFQNISPQPRSSHQASRWRTKPQHSSDSGVVHLYEAAHQATTSTAAASGPARKPAAAGFLQIYDHSEGRQNHTDPDAMPKTIQLQFN